MTPTVDGVRELPVRPRRRLARLTAAGVTVGVAAAAIVGSTGASAAAKPNAQSVGRFLDGAVGGNALQQLADVKDARATAPGTTSAQNQLNATLLGQLSVPLGSALNLPGGGVFKLGAVNQVAQAKTDGSSFGGSGAVSNGGGVSLGGTNDIPADATIDLSGAALGSVSIPGLPGGSATTAAALGGVQAKIGAVTAIARTKTGGAFAAPQYQIAGLKLVIGSPALGGLLSQLETGGKAVTTLLQPVASLLGATLPAACSLVPGTLPSTISLDKGAVVIDPATASITVDLAILLDQLGVKLNSLPPNTDLLAYLLNNLSSILSTGLENVINGITQPLSDLGTKCLPALGPLGATLGALLGTLTTGQSTLETAVNTIAAQLGSAGAPGIDALTSNLSKLLAIGVNVQQGAFPLSSAPSPKYAYTSALAATPDQNTPVVDGQGVVRALEIDVAGGQVASLALGNAAAGPSSAAVVATPTPTPTTSVPSTAVPTGVPAGAAGHQGGGSPALPIVVVLVGLVLAGGGVTAYRFRTKFSH